jgi:hypothetical protein
VIEWPPVVDHRAGFWGISPVYQRSQFMLNKHLVTYFFAVQLGLASQSSFAEKQRFNFDQTAAGGLPSGWVIAATNPDGPLEHFQIVSMETSGVWTRRTVFC